MAYDNFNKVASALRDDCSFYVGIGEVSPASTANGDMLEFWPSDVG